MEASSGRDSVIDHPRYGTPKPTSCNQYSIEHPRFHLSIIGTSLFSVYLVSLTSTLYLSSYTTSYLNFVF